VCFDGLAHQLPYVVVGLDEQTVRSCQREGFVVVPAPRGAQLESRWVYGLGLRV
jgi:hypothetical protein